MPHPAGFLMCALAKDFFRNLSSGNTDGHRVRVRPGCFAIGEFEAIHGDRELAAVHLHQEVVIVDAMIGIRVTWSTVDRISVSATPAGDEVNHAIALVPL